MDGPKVPPKNIFNSFYSHFSLVCHFYEIEKFEEANFCKFLIENKLSFAKWRLVKMNFSTQVIDSFKPKIWVVLLLRTLIYKSKMI